MKFADVCGRDSGVIQARCVLVIAETSMSTSAKRGSCITQKACIRMRLFPDESMTRSTAVHSVLPAPSKALYHLKFTGPCIVVIVEE